MADPGTALDQLPTKVKSVADAIVRAARKMEIGSRAYLVPVGNDLPASFILHNANFHLSAFLSVGEQERRIFFFFSAPGIPDRLIYEATLDLSVAPVASRLFDAPARTGDVRIRIVQPPFVIARPTRDQLNRFVSDHATRRNAMLLATGSLGDEYLGAMWSSNGRFVQIRFTDAEGRGSTIAPHHDTAPLAPAMSLLDAVRDWAAEDFDKGEAVPFTRPSNGVDPLTLEIIDRVLDAYREAQRSVASTAPDPIDAASGLATEYELARVMANIKLRLRPDGTLATDADEKDAFHLRLRVGIEPDASSSAARLVIGPPDFLVDGQLYEAFVGLVQKELRPNIEQDERNSILFGIIRRQLRDSGIANAEDSVIRQFLETKENFHSVFRIKRDGDEDTDIIVLQGRMLGQTIVVWLSGIFRVKAAAEPPSVSLLGDWECLFAVQRSSSRHVLDGQVIGYVRRLLLQIRTWIGSFT